MRRARLRTLPADSVPIGRNTRTTQKRGGKGKKRKKGGGAHGQVYKRCGGGGGGFECATGAQQCSKALRDDHSQCCIRSARRRLHGVPPFRIGIIIIIIIIVVTNRFDIFSFLSVDRKLFKSDTFTFST